MRARALGIVVVAGFAWACAAACELVLPTHEATTATTTPDAASPSAADTCAHALPPPKPQDAGGGGTTDLVFVVQSLHVDEQVGPGVGLDLDHTCTCQPGQRPSCAPPISGAAEGVTCDTADGRDLTGNFAFGEILEATLANTPLGDIDKRIATGYLSYLIVIRHLRTDGLPSTGVFVDFYDSSGLLDVDDAGNSHRRSPTWDAGEAWAVDCALSRASFCPDGGTRIGDGGLLSGYYDSEAYVTEDNTLVAHVSTSVVGLGLTTITLHDVVLVAHMTQLADRTVTRLDGQLVGRFDEQDIFSTLATLKDENNAYLCAGNPNFETLRHNVCQRLDIASDPGRDGDGGTCDALSVAMPFTAVPAQLGVRADHLPQPSGCDASVGCAD